MKLTEEILRKYMPQYDEFHHEEVIIQQILENQKIAEYFKNYVNPKCIKELKEKAEKYDKRMTRLAHYRELEQENKQLKDFRDLLYAECPQYIDGDIGKNGKIETKVIILKSDYQNLKQKLEKIRVNIKCWDDNPDRIRKQIKEILEESTYDERLEAAREHHDRVNLEK